MDMHDTLTPELLRETREAVTRGVKMKKKREQERVHREERQGKKERGAEFSGAETNENGVEIDADGSVAWNIQMEVLHGSEGTSSNGTSRHSVSLRLRLP
jgi:hypothetical protein